MIDLNGQYMRIKSEIDIAIQEVLNSAAFIQGPQVQSFATALGNYVGAKAVVPCANGTDALQIAMMALDAKHGDEVILPVHTYVATAEVIALLGLKPVFVDVDPASFNIDSSQIELKITSRTKIIVPVHLYGQCADMETILKISSEHGLHVIEDAAQSFGAQYTFADGTTRKAGTMSTIGTTSFFPSKNLGCFGDGGAIFSNDPVLGEKIRMIANHGQKIKYHHDMIGVNSRLDTLQAAILLVKLRYLDEYEKKRNSVAAYYDRALANVSGVEIPHRSSFSTHVFHQYTLKVERRDDLKKHLEKSGIPSMIYYPVPLHLQKAYRLEGFGLGAFPVTEELSQKVISLPIHTEMDEATMSYICTEVKKFYNG